MTERTFDRVGLAKEQLDTALDLFLDLKRHSSAITLAGAAEEIFGRLLTIKGKKSAIEESFQFMAELHRRPSGNELSKKEYISRQNQARDSLKHLQDDKGPVITLDLEEAACWMLVRALQNGRELGLEFNRYQDFDNWFYENIVGV